MIWRGVHFPQNNELGSQSCLLQKSTPSSLIWGLVLGICKYICLSLQQGHYCSNHCSFIMFWYPGREVPPPHSLLVYCLICLFLHREIPWEEFVNMRWRWKKVSGWLKGCITKDRGREKEGFSHLRPKLPGSQATQGESWVESVKLAVRTPSEPQGGNICEMAREWRPPHLFWEVGQWRAREPGSLWVGEGTMVIILWKNLENVGRSGRERS